jgi:hypothetical protein
MSRRSTPALFGQSFRPTRQGPRSLKRRFTPAFGAGLEALEARRLLANITPSAVISSTPDGGHFDYTITLSNSRQSNSGIGTFWYAWIPGQDYLSTRPVSVTPPTGWTDQITNEGPGDGFAIEFVASNALYNVQPGGSMTFKFSSNDPPASINGNSQFFPGAKVSTAFVYPGAPFSDGGHQFVVTPAPTLTSITVTPANPTVVKGKTEQFVATGHFSDNSSQNLTGQVAWFSTQVSIATINPGGLATGVALGTTSIIASLNGVSGSTNLTVNPPPPLRVVSISPSNGTIPGLPGGHIVVTFNQPIAGITPDVASGGGFSAHPVAVTLTPEGPGGQFLPPSALNVGSQPIHATLVYHVNPNGTSTITLTPQEPLGTNAYMVTVSGNLTSVAGKPLTAGNGALGAETSKFTLKTVAPNAVPLKVTGITTLRGTVNITNNATIPQPDTIAIAFNKPADFLMINGSTIQLLAGPTNTVVNAAVAYNPTTNTAFLTPEAILSQGTTYTIKVSGQITDNQAFPNPDHAFSLGTTIVRTFQVNADAVTGAGPLVVMSSNGHVLATPAFGSTRTTPLGYVSIPFSEAVNLASLGATTVTLTGQKGGLNNGALDAADAPLNVRIAFNPNVNTMIIVPTVLVGNDTYHYSIGAMSAANGDPLTNPGGNLPLTGTFVVAVGVRPAAIESHASLASLGAVVTDPQRRNPASGAL